MFRRLRDYCSLVRMVNSRVYDSREMAREAVRRHGWRIAPVAGRQWRECFEVVLHFGELWLHYNDASGSTHVIRWKAGYGIYDPARD